MSLAEENKRLVEQGKLRETRARSSGKTSHKPNIPATAKKWSIGQKEYAIIRFSFFWELVEKEKEI
jgi:hypothetical protein